MATLVMLDIFSGRPNPVWPMDDDLVSQMQSVVETGKPALTNLGYRGFKIIESQTDLGGLAFAAHDAIGQFSETGLVVGNPDAEKALLTSGVSAGAIGSDLQAYISQSIDNPPAAAGMFAAAGGGGVTCPPCGGADAPAYNPAYWNDPSRQPFNNCYAYANNNATGTFPQPGRGSGAIFGSIDCGDVGAASQRDGLVPTDTYEQSRAGWYVALVIWPDNDYHWYRQDDVGCWSHKPGGTAARNWDNSGNAIADPQSCDRGPYTVFCTFMVTNASVTIA